MATHIGPHNPNIAEGWKVREGEDGLWRVYVPENIYCDCGCPNCDKVLEVQYREHGRTPVSEDPDGCYEWLEALQQSYDDDYDRYTEEHSYEIAQMERYEAFRNEY